MSQKKTTSSYSSSFRMESTSRLGGMAPSMTRSFSSLFDANEFPLAGRVSELVFKYLCSFIDFLF